VAATREELPTIHALPAWLTRSIFTPFLLSSWLVQTAPAKKNAKKVAPVEEKNVTLGPNARDGEHVFGVAHIYASFNDTFVVSRDAAKSKNSGRCGDEMKCLARCDAALGWVRKQDAALVLLTTVSNLSFPFFVFPRTIISGNLLRMAPLVLVTLKL
jgi:hypothetical protein